jgi:hypothetical protein
VDDFVSECRVIAGLVAPNVRFADASFDLVDERPVDSRHYVHRPVRRIRGSRPVAGAELAAMDVVHGDPAGANRKLWIFLPSGVMTVHGPPNRP